MTEMSVVQLDHGRAFLDHVTLPSPPPTRVYISGRLYRLSPAATGPLPPIANVVKVIHNWIGPASRIAKNIYYLLTGGGFVASDPTQLKTLANTLMTQAAAAALTTTVHAAWKLNSITCKDAGGTTAQADSDHAPINGLSSGGCLPPQVALVASWQVAESYRGGKPRWYFPGVSDTAEVTSGGSAVTVGVATAFEAALTTYMNNVNGIVSGPPGTFRLGTVSYYHAHSVRPTPLFMTFINAKVHERLDSQRRRSGPESAFGVIP